MKEMRQKGSTLIEVMVALSILVVSVFSIFSLVNRSISLNRVVTDQYVAGFLAAEGVEIVKNIIDTNLSAPHCRAWNYGLTRQKNEAVFNSAVLLPASGNPLRFNPSTGLYTYSDGEPTRFYRTIEIENIGNPVEELRVNAIVSWRGRGGSENSVNVEDHFYSWRDTSSRCTN